MTSPNTTLAQALLSFADSYIDFHAKNNAGRLPETEFDEQWLSPCINEKTTSEVCYWQPVSLNKLIAEQVIAEQFSFANVEQALNLTLHQDIKTYFSTILSAEITAKCSDGELTLLFAWNEEDFARLQENIIGHIMMKQRLKQNETIFFAVTDEEDIIISVDNTTGEVWAERVGCKPHKKIAESIEQLLTQLLTFS